MVLGMMGDFFDRILVILDIRRVWSLFTLVFSRQPLC